jgi:5-methylcytosine-specific restriction endonuclease McrA
VKKKKPNPIRLALYNDQKGICWYCANPVVFAVSTIDHIIPKKKGGTSHYSNLVMACRSCNEDKGHKNTNRLKTPGRLAALEERAKQVALQREQGDHLMAVWLKKKMAQEGMKSPTTPIRGKK